MEKIKEGTTEIISLDEFVDTITEGKGEKIKKELRELQ